MAELIRQVGISEETCISGKRSTGVGGRSSAADQAYPSGKHTVDGGRKASLIRDCQDYVRE